MSKREYKYELHCHTSDVSRCASSDAHEAIQFYKERGYDGIVITDHYSPQTFLFHKAIKPYKYIDMYLKGYKKAKALAGDDFTVLLGCEVRFFGTIDDFLIYGIDEDFLRSSGNLMALYLKKLFRLCDSKDLLLLEAHPFRELRFRHNPKYLHGCEVFNGKDAGTSAGRKAREWAKKCGFSVLTSGGDFHDKKKCVPGGIKTSEPIKTNADLLRILRSGSFTLIEE
ncbi:MAG: PHP domain-containing protein [Clostridia bacterium]|nr:PHP domain-containing protein [Clostridia bacterium]